MRLFAAWLADRSPVDGDPLADEPARNWAVRDYKRHLKAVRRWRPSSVNLALAAPDSFYGYLGLGRPVVRREELPAKAPRALSVEQQRRLLRIAERCDRAIVVLLLYTALRLAELVALDVDDARVSARKGVVIVRSGKGDAFREVPLNALARQVLEEWLPERKRSSRGPARCRFAWTVPVRFDRRDSTPDAAAARGDLCASTVAEDDPRDASPTGPGPPRCQPTTGACRYQACTRASTSSAAVRGPS